MPHSRSTRPPRRKRVNPGLYAVLATLGLVLVIAAVAAVTGGASNTPAPTSIDDVESIVLGEGDSGREMRIQLTSEDDRATVVGEILAKSYQPESPTRRRVEEPQAWFFLEDGRTLHIRADRGRFDTPVGRDRPEQGRLEGDVTLRLFAESDTGERPIPGVTPPLLQAVAEAPVDFDLAVGQLETPGRLTVTSDTIEFAGSGVNAFVNEPQQRIDVLTIDRGEKLVYTPQASAATDTTPTTSARAPPTESQVAVVDATTATPAEPSASATANATPPRVDLYAAEFLENVTVEQSGRSIRSDTLAVWSRLVDREIPSQAAIPSPVNAPRAQSLAEILVGAVFAAQSTAVLPSPSSAPSDPITLTWSGRMKLEAIPPQSTPSELAETDLFARFTAGTTGAVTFADTAGSRNAQGRAAVVEYDDAARAVSLRSPVADVRLSSPATGELTGATNMTFNIDEGIAFVSGSGALVAAQDGTLKDDGARRRRRIRWSDAAAFTFARGGERLEAASFEGEVRGANDDATLDAASLDVTFAPKGAADASDIRLLRVDAEDADATDGKGSSLVASTLAVHFAEGTQGEDADPVRVVTSGETRGVSASGGRIVSETLDATLARNDEGDVEVVAVEASGVQNFEDGRGRSATASRLIADLTAESAILEGGASGLATASTPTGAIAGDRIELLGASRSVAVDGVGSFERAGDDGVAITATWTRSMRFDDVAGALRCSGNASANASDTLGRRDALAAEHLFVSFTPSPIDASEQSDAERQLLNAIAEGVGTSPTEWATVERRLIDPTAPSGSPVELYHLEGARVELDEGGNLLRVPGPGLMVIKTAGEGASSDAQATDPFATEAGDALFEWSGAMTMNRRSGVATFERNASIVHRRASDGAVTTIAAERVEAAFAEREGAGAQLTRAVATGLVSIASDARRINASRVVFDADRDIAIAEASDTETVMIYDETEGVTQEDDGLEWDLARDRIRVQNARTVTIPR